MKKTVQFFFACALLTTAFSFTTQNADADPRKWVVRFVPCTTEDGTPGTRKTCQYDFVVQGDLKCIPPGPLNPCNPNS